MGIKRFAVALIVCFAVLTGIGLGALKVVNERRANSTVVQDQKKKDISITIIEGKRWEEIAAQMDTAGVTNYDDFKAVMQANPAYEGTLFPDTYRFFPNTPAADVIAKLREEYTDKTKAIAPTHDDLVLASIIEREAENDTDRPIVAGVYTNRLKVGMTMGSDPTVQYAKDTNAYKAAGYLKTYTFWKEIFRSDYQNAKSPFNTYLQKGLPPQAICNPGIKSIEAAQNPTSHGYYYFGYKDNKLLLSKTLQEHESKL